MKMIFVYAWVLVFVCFASLVHGAEAPDPMKEVAGFAYSEEKVFVSYRDGSEFQSTVDKMGSRAFETFTKNLSRVKGSPAIVEPTRVITARLPVKVVD